MTGAKHFLADTNSPICRLEVKTHFDGLSDKEKTYAHFIARASWEGARVLSTTISPESPTLYELFLAIFTGGKAADGTPLVTNIDELKKKANVSEESWKYFLEYSAQVLNNLGNYKSFGDTKFLPRLPSADFDTIIKVIGSPQISELWNKVKEVAYASEPDAQLLNGFPAEGHVSGYYSQNVSKQDVQSVQDVLEKNNISALNTRMIKSDSGDYEVRIASAKVTREPQTFKTADGKTVKIVYGEFAPSMQKVEDNIRKAIPYAANEHQKKMLEAYAESFSTGSIDAHKDSQRHWIRDIGPNDLILVESNIGFIETYKDPAGIRAEWEGFVAVVNKEMTQKFEKLVNNAETYVGRLPWPKEFEKDKFNKPDFTSLEVLNFATSGTPPAGINIPNYDDIRMTEGFKNVSLGNVLSAKAPSEKITFIKEEDLALYDKYRGEAFEVQVGLHELLGHGSGKLLQEEPAGQFNFDPKNPPISPLTGKPVTTYYKPGETWGSVFKAAAASYEECRAESVAMFLCVNKDILEIFGHKDPQEAADIIYVCYLQMARAGLVSLEFYDPKNKKWGQAHMQARYAILQIFIEAGIARVEEVANGTDLLIHLDRSRIEGPGVKAVGEFLQKLQIYKATADATGGLDFYTKSTSVSDQWTKWREIVLNQKQPRKMFLQGNTFEKNGQVTFKEYPISLEGFIESFIERNV
ncbi:peptidase family M49-domain-containing protein [Phlyctochytrium arcticum]|nr:peptidase family M49-domain-containing protein [Phlyctochytrium arcticum]